MKQAQPGAGLSLFEPVHKAPAPFDKLRTGERVN
jgi:hypothetical protein